MKKILGIISLAVFALTGCESKAQTTTVIDAGNPDSANMLMMESYEVINVPAVNNAVMMQQPATANVQPPAALNNNNLNSNGTAVFESVTDTQTPNAEDVDINAVSMPVN